MPGANLVEYQTAAAVIDGTSGINLDGTTGISGIGAIPVGAKGAVITAFGAGIRWRLDGTKSTTGVGHYQAANSIITFDSWTAPGNDWRSVLKAMKFSPSSSGTVTLSISYFD